MGLDEAVLPLYPFARQSLHATNISRAPHPPEHGLLHEEEAHGIGTVRSHQRLRRRAHDVALCEYRAR